MELKKQLIKKIKNINDPEKIIFLWIFLKELLGNS